MQDGEAGTLKDKVERVVEENTHYKEETREDKIPTTKEKIERAKEETLKENLPPTFTKPIIPKPITQLPYLQIPELKLLKPGIKEVIQTFSIPSEPLKSEPLKVIKPSLLNIQPLQPPAATIKELMPEKPKIEVMKPVLKLPFVVEEKHSEMEILKIEIQKPTKTTPDLSQLTTENIVKAEKVSLEVVVDTQKLDTTTLDTTTGEESIAFLEEDVLELPILPDIILDPSSEGGSLGSVVPEGPVYVVVTEKLYEIITMLCGLVYRIKGKEGLPSTWVEGKVDSEFLNRTLIERDVVMMLAKDIVEAVEGKRDLDRVAEEFRERIEGIYKEKRFRFIVLKTPIEVLDKVEKLLKWKLAQYVPKLLIYKDKKIDIEAYELLIRTCWGFVRSSKRIIVEPGEYYNECANVFQEQIKSVIRQVQNKLNPLKWPKSSPTGEDWLHKALKYIVINHLVENEGIDPDLIETEYAEDVKETPIDIYVKMKGIAVEIETLYGRGEPAERINDLLRRYKERVFKDQLWLVFPNQQALLFCDDIVRLTKDYRKLGVNVEPYILDISGEGHEILSGKKMAPGLIKLVNVIKLLRNKGLKREVKWLAELGV